MDNNLVDKLEKELKNATAQETIKLAFDLFQNELCFATSLAWEDQAITKMIVDISPQIEIFTLDTGRLFQENYNTIEATESFFDIKITKLLPNSLELEKMINNKGVNSFYRNVDNRIECCNIRKTKPLQKFLQTKKAWITGQRRSQSVTRYSLKKVEWDDKNQLVKFNPIAEWLEQQTIDFVLSNNIPFNELQTKGFRSLGCMPCTRAIGEEQDIRDGRWWWETPESKECGLHK